MPPHKTLPSIQIQIRAKLRLLRDETTEFAFRQTFKCFMSEQLASHSIGKCAVSTSDGGDIKKFHDCLRFDDRNERLITRQGMKWNGEKKLLSKRHEWHDIIPIESTF
jgi:hypothetical protein